MSITIRQPGILTMIQDLGRYGEQKYGVIVGGAMDPISLRIANILVRNEQSEGGLEIVLFGLSFQFNEDTLIAITGGQLHPTIDGKPAPMWRPIRVPKGAILQFKSGHSGSRAYIAFAGGINVPKVLGSKSTYLNAKIGGFEGRALQAGDTLAFGKMSEESHTLMNQLETDQEPLWLVNYQDFITFNKHKTIRIVKGSEYDKFDQESLDAILNEQYTLTTHADRMGYKLEGHPLKMTEEFDLISEGVTFGTIQVPSSGQPIILMADRQTVGGYPKIAQVISADLPKLAQSLPMNQMRFQLVTIREAEQALINREQALKLLETSIRLKIWKGV